MLDEARLNRGGRPCEKCWSDAYVRMMTLGGTQSYHYTALIIERVDSPCTEEEQRGEQWRAIDPRDAVDDG